MFFIFSAAAIFISCESKQEAKIFALKSADDKPGQVKDTQILMDAAAINWLEIQFGQLAQSNSDRGEVKQLGKLMEKQHSDYLNSLQALASKKNITLTTSFSDTATQVYQELFHKKGNEFDIAYCNVVIGEYEQAIDKFENANTEAVDEDTRHWIKTMLPVLKK